MWHDAMNDPAVAFSEMLPYNRNPCNTNVFGDIHVETTMEGWNPFGFHCHCGPSELSLKFPPPGRFSLPYAAELYTGCASFIGVVPVCNEFRPRGSDCLDNTDKLLSFGLV